MTPGTHLPGTIYRVGFFSNMYEYTAVIMLAGDVAHGGEFLLAFFIVVGLDHGVENYC